MKDKEKEFIGIFKNVLNIVLTALLTLIAYMFVNIDTLSRLKLTAIYGALATLVMCVVVISVILNKSLKRLEEFKC